MFKTSATCPEGTRKEAREIVSCEGHRDDGVMKNVCAYCGKYRKHIKQKFPDVVQEVPIVK